jgi:hypothetical protein
VVRPHPDREPADARHIAASRAQLIRSTMPRCVDARPVHRRREDDGMRRCRLHVLGASGSGTTTLARALANHWSAPHADADDYFWLSTDPPYVERRPEADRLRLMREVFVAREAWVLNPHRISRASGG